MDSTNAKYLEVSDTTPNRREEDLTVNRRRLVIGSIVCIAAVSGWYLFRPELIFVTKTVNESLPAQAAPEVGATAMPAGILSTGRFHSVAHESTGVATVHQLTDGKRLVRLTEFETSNGPDVRVYLVAADDASDNDTVSRAGFVDLGALKGNKGDQNYEVSQALDLGKYRAVTIWCRRFGVNFATARLTPERQI
jgi:hypothetical protein